MSTTHPAGGPRIGGPARVTEAQRPFLQAIADLGGSDITLSQLADHLGTHLNTPRPHCESLVEAGFLTLALVAGRRPGRRPHGYSITARGRAALQPPAVSEAHELIGAIGSYLVRKTNGHAEARAIGEIWGEQRSSSLPTNGDPLETMIDVLDSLGFDPVRGSSGDDETVILQACPLLPLTGDNPEFVCQVHQGLINGVMRSVGANQGLELLPFSEPNGCRVVVSSADTPA